MNAGDTTLARLGDEPPLVAGGRGAPPDRREISARWLSGTFLTGLTSTVLMGVALLAAYDGRQLLATPPEIMAANAMPAPAEDGDSRKAARVAATATVTKARDRRRMEISTMVSSGDRKLVRMVPFVQVAMALGAGHSTERNYPRFDPLTVFSEPSITSGTTTTGTIYGAKVESEVALRTVGFPMADALFDEAAGLNAEEVEEIVRKTGAILTDGAIQVAALHYVDPSRFGEMFPGQAVTAPYNVKIVQENVSVSPRPEPDDDSMSFAEEVIAFRTADSISGAFRKYGYDGSDADGMAEAIATLVKDERLPAGAAVRLGIETKGEKSRIVRASVYERNAHVLTIALDDRAQYVPADEPDGVFDIAALFSGQAPVPRVRADLPSVYDGIYQAAFSYGLNREMTRELIKLLAADVDYQARLNPADSLEVFFSNPDESNSATTESQVLYVKASFGGNKRSFFRFQPKDGPADFFDENGRSARQFLLRNPVPNGTFRSGFGMRRHPILRYSKMHTGADWAAPTGTPIIASGNGTVEKAGWAGGYGRQTIIRHANGYETSYSHQSAIAKGVVPGARIRQGQIIGYIGSSGLSTGPHLHYELMVNGTKVDPMRVRLPTGKVLKGNELAEFQAERKRIEALLEAESPDTLKLASTKP